ncbi:MAG: hypothetical protein LBH05_07790 [Deferribacteraceae bacterium]|jgi:predicted hotdog family 3-hydroxylacyl-ACP dehydratase|nr:hypothetical protein [Deferribacteraceae bacterium]
MLNTKYNDLKDILPHKPPMILIDRVLEYDLEARSLAAEFDVTEKSLFFDSSIGGAPSWVGMEYMAQALGAFSGIYIAENDGGKPEIAFLLGSRDYQMFVDIFELNKTYTVYILENFADATLGSYHCLIKNGDFMCAKADITAYKPKDPFKIINNG